MGNYPNAVLIDDYIVERTSRAFNSKYPELPQMHHKFAKLRRNFNATPRKRLNSVLGDENTRMNIIGYFAAYLRTSIRAVSIKFGISYSTIQEILAQHNFHPYSFIRLQKLVDTDLDRRFSYKNARTSKHSETYMDRRSKIYTRWHFYENNLNANLQNLNDVEDFIDGLSLVPALETLWFQMDGATSHDTRTHNGQMKNNFKVRWCGNRGPWIWPPRSLDFTPLDIYWWGRVKESDSDNKYGIAFSRSAGY
ncbi:hypothetical protein HHI36_023019 [Cryptolaemus montrouzieri]|uniref:Uncharacterized protein n=1 Tax=Cryptolaemus montrouzieri TaxID=559131 RepID=A0ABD2PFP6_9CUCU